MSTIAIDRHTIRDILPGDDNANLRWLHKVLREWCEGTIVCTPTELREATGFTEKSMELLPLMQQLATQGLLDYWLEMKGDHIRHYHIDVYASVESSQCP